MAKSAINDLDIHIGKRLRKLRQCHKVSAEKLAEALQTTQQQISRYENGNNKLSASQLYFLAHCLNVPVSWFYGDYAPDKSMPVLCHNQPSYESGKIREEIEMLARHWPELSVKERDVILKLLDTFLLERPN